MSCMPRAKSRTVAAIAQKAERTETPAGRGHTLTLTSTGQARLECAGIKQPTLCTKLLQSVRTLPPGPYPLGALACLVAVVVGACVCAVAALTVSAHFTTFLEEIQLADEVTAAGAVVKGVRAARRKANGRGPTLCETRRHKKRLYARCLRDPHPLTLYMYMYMMCTCASHMCISRSSIS